MNCRECSLLLLDYHFETLEPHRHTAVAEHLLTCESCRATLEKLARSVPDQLAWPDEDPPAELAQKAMDRIAAEIPPADEGEERRAEPAPEPEAPAVRRPPSRVRTGIKAVAAMALLGLGGWVWNVMAREVVLAAAVDGQSELRPGGLATLRMSVFDSERGTPIEGARIRVLLRDAQGKETVVFEGDSNQWGTLDAGRRLPDLPEGGYTMEMTASKDGDSTTVTRRIKVERKFRVLLSSDKPTYQPGQVIHVRALARDAATNKPPEGKELTFTVVDAKGNKVGRSTQKVDAFGVASLDFRLADEIVMGTWRVEAELGGAQSALDLTVSRYVLPKLAVQVTPDKPWYKPGDVVSARLETRYFFGKPAARAKVKATLGVFVDSFRAVAEAQAVADESGVVSVELPIPPALPGLPLAQGSAALDLSVEVVDVAGQRAQKHQAITVAEQEFSVTAVPEGGTLVPGVENRLLVMVVRPDGEPVAGAKVTLLTQGVPSGTTAEDGIAAIAFRASGGGRRDLRLRVESRDGARAEQVVEVETGALPGVVRTERTLYTAGETVRGEILAASPASVVFLDLVRDGQTFATHTVPLTGDRGQFAVDLPAEAAGTVTLYAYTPGRETGRSRKTIFVGEPRSLQVSVTGEKDTYAPGKEAKLLVKVLGDDGKPAAASVGLAVVDESVFALVSKEPALLKAYFLLAEELSKPRYELDPARVVADASRDRAASILFSQPRPVDVERLTQTSEQELYRRASQLRDQKDETQRTGWGLGLVFLGVIFEGAIRFVFEKLFRALFEKRWWRTFALLLGGVAGFVLKMDGAPMVVALIAGFVPLTLTLFVEGIVRAGKAGFALHMVVGVVLLLVGLGLMTSLQPGMRSTFAASANALAGSDSEFASPPEARRKALADFGAAGDEDGAPAGELQVVGAADAEPLGDFAGRGGGAPGPVSGIAEAGKAGLAAPEAKAKADKQLAPTDAATKAKVRVRSWFPETLFWSPGVITGTDGTASVSLPMADSITTWRVSATASASDGRLGVGQGALRVFQDFFVEIDLPVALTLGDEVEVPVAVHNYLSEPQKVKLEVEQAPWFTALSPTIQEVALGAGEVKGVPLRLKAAAFGKQTLTVYAFGARLQDAVRREVEVRPDGLRAEAAVGGPLGPMVSVTGRLPDGAIPGTERVLLRIYPGLFSAALDGIEGVFAKPSGCFEQTSSTTYPNVLVLDYLRRTKRSKPDVEARAIEYIQQGYQRLLSYEVKGGGFEWFGRAPANQVLTAYGLLEFADMAKVYEVDPAVIRRTQEWLISRQQYDGTWNPDQSSLQDGLYRSEFDGRIGVTAYVAWALVESGYRGEATDRALAFLWGRSADVDDAYTLGLIGNALMAGGRESEAVSVLDKLAAKAQPEPGGKVRFPSGSRTAVYSGGVSADVESTALAVMALSRGGRAVAGGALDWMLSVRDPSGAWPSTQATVLALRTILSGAGGRDDSSNATVEIAVAGEAVERLKIDAETSDLVRTVDLTRFAKPGSPLSIELRMTGAARAQYQLATLAWVPRPRPEEALALTTRFDRLTLAPDDTLTAVATATWRRAGPSGMVLLTLGVPPGFEVDAESVGRLVAEGRIGKFAIGRELLLYVDGLRTGEPLELPYKLRARFPVRAKAPASSAFLYYEPEVRAEAPSIDVAVAER